MPMTISSFRSGAISYTTTYGRPRTTHSYVPETLPTWPMCGSRPNSSMAAKIRPITLSAAVGRSFAIHAYILSRSCDASVVGQFEMYELLGCQLSTNLLMLCE